MLSNIGTIVGIIALILTIVFEWDKMQGYWRWVRDWWASRSVASARKRIAKLQKEREELIALTQSPARVAAHVGNLIARCFYLSGLAALSAIIVFVDDPRYFLFERGPIRIKPASWDPFFDRYGGAIGLLVLASIIALFLWISVRGMRLFTDILCPEIKKKMIDASIAKLEKRANREAPPPAH